MTFEELQNANKLIKTTPIQGKEYAQVPERIKAFRSVYPEGSITTEIISMENGVITMKATVCTDDGVILATGTAQEKEGSTFINKSSFVENCETSCIGRALGLAGFGIDVSVASAEEVQNAILNQGAKPEPKPEWNPDAVVPAGTLICEECMKVIKDTTNSAGEAWSAESIASYSEKRFHRRLCVECQKKMRRKEA